MLLSLLLYVLSKEDAMDINKDAIHVKRTVIGLAPTLWSCHDVLTEQAGLEITVSRVICLLRTSCGTFDAFTPFADKASSLQAVT